MSTTTSSPGLFGSSRGVFVTTHWSVVVAAGRKNSEEAQQALTRLCETYWYPLYAWVRRRGHSPEDAQDLTQEFFARLLEHNWVGEVDPAKGRIGLLQVLGVTSDPPGVRFRYKLLRLLGSKDKTPPPATVPEGAPAVQTKAAVAGPGPGLAPALSGAQSQGARG